MNNKFDLIYYAINPEEWNKVKSDILIQIERSNILRKHIEKIILYDNDTGLDRICFQSLFWEAYKYHQLIDNIHVKLPDNWNDKGSILIDKSFQLEDIKGKYEFYAEFMQGGDDHFVWIKDLDKIKEKLLSLASDLSYFIGHQNSLITMTDLVILKFQGKSINKEFLHLTEAPFLKDSEKLKKFRKPYYEIYESIHLDRKFSDEEKDFAYQLGFVDFHKWEFAFIVLAYREKDNLHFLKLWNDKSYEPLNTNNLDNLKHYSQKFYKSYNKYMNG